MPPLVMSTLGVEELVITNSQDNGHHESGDEPAEECGSGEQITKSKRKRNRKKKAAAAAASG